MKILQVIQSYIGAFGIVPLKRHDDYRINVRSILAFTSIFLTLLSSVTYLLLDAKTIRDYTQCFYVTTTAMCNCFMFPVIFVRAPEFFRFVKDVENTIENRKWSTNSTNFCNLFFNCFDELWIKDRTILALLVANILKMSPFMNRSE